MKEQGRAKSFIPCTVTLTIVEQTFRRSLIFFRGPDYDGISQEISDTIEARRSKLKNGTIDNTSIILQAIEFSSPTKTDAPFIICLQCVSNVMSWKFIRPFSCIGIIYILFQLSGFEVVYAYTESFFEESGVKLDPSLAAVVTG